MICSLKKVSEKNKICVENLTYEKGQVSHNPHMWQVILFKPLWYYKLHMITAIATQQKRLSNDVMSTC